jgi:integrase
MDPLETTIKNLKPTLAENSVKTYASLLRSLFITLDLDEPIDASTIASYYKEIIAYVETLTPTKRKQILSACLVFVNDTDNDSEYAFKNIINSSFKEEQKNTELQEFTWNQKQAYLSWKEILDKREKLKESVAHLWKREAITRDETQKMQDYVIACLYTMNPPRRALDYCLMTNPIYDTESNDTKVNHIDIESQSFIFNVYKTAKTYEQQRVRINDTLFSVLKDWIPIKSKDWLLTKPDHNRFNSDTMTRRLAFIFDKKGFGVNMLRHAYVNDVILQNMPLISDLKDTATSLGHSHKETVLYKKRV